MSLWIVQLLVVPFLPLQSFALLTNGRSKFVANIIGIPTDFETYRNQVIPDNAGKWRSVKEYGTNVCYRYHWTESTNIRIPIVSHSSSTTWFWDITSRALSRKAFSIRRNNAMQ